MLRVGKCYELVAPVFYLLFYEKEQAYKIFDNIIEINPKDKFIALTVRKEAMGGFVSQYSYDDKEFIYDTQYIIKILTCYGDIGYIFIPEPFIDHFQELS